MSDRLKNKEDRPIWLTSLADADRAGEPSDGVEARLSVSLRSRRRSVLLRRMGGAALAAGMVIGAVYMSPTTASFPPAEFADDSVTDAMTEAMSLSASDEADFIPTKLAAEQPLESVRVVRVSLPTGALSRYGIAPIETGVPAGEVTAELLVGQDGIARAIRIVR